MKSSLASMLAAAALCAGCASSPVKPVSSGPSAGQAATLLGTTAAGAAAGNAINSRYGAPVGAAVGAGIGMLLNRSLSDHEQQVYLEGFEEGKRQGRLEVLRQENATRALAERSSAIAPAGTAPIRQLTHYEGGVVEGVRYGPRDSAGVSITEPPR